MRPTDFGRVDVMIKRFGTARGKRSNMIVLIYPLVYSDEYLIYCPLNTREHYVHKRVTYQTYRNLFTHDAHCRSLPYDEALVYLKKYCAWHRLDWRKFRICKAFGIELAHFMDKEGLDKCPVELDG